MHFSFDRWIRLTAPLWAAAPKAKNRRSPKPLRKSKPAARPVAVKRAVKTVARPAKPRPNGAGKNRGHPVAAKPVLKPPVRAPQKAAPAEPPPKPVQPVGRPILLSPEQGKYADSVHPKFRWLSVGGATRYEVSWGQDPSLSNAYLVVSAATEAAVPVEKPLTAGVVYYWRARGGNEAGWGPWSNVSSFSVLEEPG